MKNIQFCPRTPHQRAKTLLVFKSDPSLSRVAKRIEHPNTLHSNKEHVFAIFLEIIWPKY